MHASFSQPTVLEILDYLQLILILTLFNGWGERGTLQVYMWDKLCVVYMMCNAQGHQQQGEINRAKKASKIFAN